MAAVQCIKSCKYKSGASVNVPPSECDLSDFGCGLIVGAGRAGLIISVTADLLGFLHRTVSQVYSELCEKRKEKKGVS